MFLLNGTFFVSVCDFRQWKQDITGNGRAMAKLLAGAESCKHVLSSRDTATCAIESLYDGIDLNSKVTRYS